MTDNYGKYNPCGHRLLSGGMLSFLPIKDIDKILTLPFFKERDSVFCVKCGQMYWTKKEKK